ncbi:MAG: alpha-ketoglutarate-dependent dioxygenase AlkB [Verrucomicrobiota bacterium]
MTTSLFPATPSVNILPKDGTVFYFGPTVPGPDEAIVFNSLLNEIPWVNDSVRLFGKTIITNRKVAWFADNDIPYSYSGTTKQAQPWSPLLLGLKQHVEALACTRFNSCLLNYYLDGTQGMSWHSDDEKSLQPHGTIASLSFGAARKFRFRHKHDGTSVALLLEPGSLLVMTGVTQTFWLHSLPKSKGIHSSRINLTFRQMLPTSPIVSAPA